MKKSISGIRGIFGKDLMLKDAIKFCNNFTNIIKTNQCVIGRDTRPTGNMMNEVVTAAIMQNGIDVLNLGISPTPVIFREARKTGAGIIITSSHNPVEWNGLKFIVNGRGINESELEILLQDKQKPIKKIGNEKSIHSDYVKEAAEIIGHVDSNPNIVLDVGGGAAKDVAPELLDLIGCKTKTINRTLEESTRGPDPTSDPLKSLIESSMKSELGFAFDLDGDRMVVVKDGKKQSPDVTLGLGIAKAIDIGYNKFVLSIDTSVSIEKFIKENGGVVKRSKVGEANVIEEMLKTNSQAGGEGSSAGFILPEFNYCRDGILTSGFIASMLGSKSFTDILKHMESFHQQRGKVEIPSEIHDKTMAQLENIMKKDYSEIITIDGIKGIIDENNWILVRKSNTEDLIRVSAESDNKEKSLTVLSKGINLVEMAYEKAK